MESELTLLENDIATEEKKIADLDRKLAELDAIDEDNVHYHHQPAPQQTH